MIALTSTAWKLLLEMIMLLPGHSHVVAHSTFHRSMYVYSELYPDLKTMFCSLLPPSLPVEVRASSGSFAATGQVRIALVMATQANRCIFCSKTSRYFLLVFGHQTSEAYVMWRIMSDYNQVGPRIIVVFIS